MKKEQESLESSVQKAEEEEIRVKGRKGKVNVEVVVVGVFKGR